MTRDSAREKLGRHRLRRIRLVSLLALVVCVGGLAIGATGHYAERLRDALFDIYQRVSPRQVPNTFPVLVVEIDQPSLAKYGPWPWPRSRIAQLTERLLEAGALVVGYDIIFATPDRFGADNIIALYPDLDETAQHDLRDAAGPDEIFRRTLAKPDSYVVVARAGVEDPADGSSRPRDTFPVEAQFKGEFPQGLLSFPTALTNIADIDELALGHGLINAEPDADGIIRRMPLVAEVGGRLMPSLALELVRVGARSALAGKNRDPTNAENENDPIGNAFGLKVADDSIALDVELGELRAVRFGHASVPVEPDGTMRLHYTRPVAGRTISAQEVLGGRAAKQQIENKLVIVGFTGVAIGDVASTPLYSKVSGVDIHAQTTEAILLGGWLERPRWAPVAEWTVAVLLALLAIWGLPLLSPYRAVVVSAGVALAVIAVSAYAFLQGRMLIDVVLPLLGAGLPATVAMAGILLSTDRRRRELNSILAANQVRAEEARHIQFAMLPSPESLALMPQGVEIAPFLAPAQDVGGDFYDAFMLDGSRVCFSIGDVAGKSISAALFMAVAKALSKSVVLRGETDLKSIANEVSREVARENPDEMFVTMLLGILDLDTGTAQLCNAGHENPVIVRAGGEVELVAMEGGPPFCVMDEFDYPVETVTLGPGDVLFLVTDGVTEAWSAQGELFGRDRLVRCLADIGDDTGNLETMVRRLVDTVREFEGAREPEDDLTVMALRFSGRGGGP